MRNNPIRWPAAWLGLTATLLLAGCAVKPGLRPSNWHLPWHKPAPVVDQPEAELPVQTDTAVPVKVLQYWSRNTLQVDLSDVTGGGSLKLLPSPVNGWPVRLEFSVRADRITQLEVQGDQRAVFPVSPPSGEDRTQVFALPPSVYSPATVALTVSWN